MAGKRSRPALCIELQLKPDLLQGARNYPPHWTQTRQSARTEHPVLPHPRAPDGRYPRAVFHERVTVNPAPLASPSGVNITRSIIHI